MRLKIVAQVVHARDHSFRRISKILVLHAEDVLHLLIIS